MNELESSADSSPRPASVTAQLVIVFLAILAAAALLPVTRELGVSISPVALFSAALVVLGAVYVTARWALSSTNVRIPDGPEPSIDQAQIEECWANRRAPRGDAEREAAHLARLLVAELALFNEDVLQDARKTGRVYASVFEDIERSRQMYVERAEVGRPDFFLQRVVERLCDGDPDRFGSPPRR